MRKTAIHVFWSDEDDCFIAYSSSPELEFCSAHGQSIEAALNEFLLVVEAHEIIKANREMLQKLKAQFPNIELDGDI